MKRTGGYWLDVSISMLWSSLLNEYKKWILLLILIGLSSLQQAEQLKALKKHHDDEIEAHEREINRHIESIDRLKKRKREIGSDSSESD